MPHAIWKIYTLFNFSLSPDPRDSICQWGPTCLLESHSWLEHSVHLLALWFVPSLHCRWHHSGFSPPLLSQVLSSAQWGVSQHSTAVTVQFSSIQLLSRVRLFVTLWTTARQASLSTTNSWSLPKLMSIESVMPSNHLILCHPLVLLPSSFPSIRVFSNESALHIKWPKYWSFSFDISPSNGLPGLIFTMDWLDLLAVQGTLKSLIQPQDNPKFNIHLHYHLHFFLHFAFLQS